jgi:hypothetical protein
MQVQTNPKLQQASFNKNESLGGCMKGLLLRILIYSGVLVNLLLPLYDFKSHGLQWKADFDEEKRIDNGKNRISSLNRYQQAYYIERGDFFSDSIEKLGAGIRDTERYSYRILSPMVPAQELKDRVQPATPAAEIVFMLAQAKHPSYPSYIGVVHTSQKGINQGKSETLVNSAICEIDSWTPLPSTLPTLKAGEIKCAPGTSLVESGKY